MTYRFPFSPFPTGWYVVASLSELAPGALTARRFMGQEVVVYRTRAGVVCLADAFCPHLGAHLGHGGTVEGETLRCPFHDFRFDTGGVCVSTPYGHAPPGAARLRQWTVREKNGYVLAWFDAAGGPPTFEVPDIPVSDAWSAPWSEVRVIRSHPQETTENSVDVGHFSAVHKYTGFETRTEMVTAGPYLHARYSMLRDAGFSGRAGQRLRVEYDVHVHGLGWSFVEARVPELGLESRYFVLPTPLDGEHVEMRIATTVRSPEEPGRISPFLRLLPVAWVRAIIGELTWRAFRGDVSQDLEIWENKRYIHPPALAKGDGPVGRYRQWARQFYPENAHAEAPRVEAAQAAPSPIEVAPAAGAVVAPAL
ncbi:MAG: Rieske 2Fe-2S domain-containing protein [Pseudomonadota bacterium]|nr:Rieske 2Fe-2S domain-containing protein [Pseudomonadota bacterium]